MQRLLACLDQTQQIGKYPVTFHMNDALKTGLGFLIFLFAASVSAQEKAEMEQRVKVDEVPERAVEWRDDAYEKARRVRWYYEETSGLKSYEAKFKWKDRRHSVEFDTTGVIQDIEVSVEWQELPEEAQQNILGYLDSTFQKYNIQKIQQQWSGSPDDLEDLIDEDESENITIRYEIEYYGKNEWHDELWEGLFDARGKMLDERMVKLRPTDNLNF